MSAISIMGKWIGKKKIWDAVHKVFIEMSPLALQIIDTPEFKKLKMLKQLGLVHYVFPGANHTRYEHCLGVYYLTGKYLDHLNSNNNSNSNTDSINGIDATDKNSPVISGRCKELMQIAALVHDIGHSMFSHLFDREFSKQMNQPHHEERGIAIFRTMVSKYNLPLSPCEVNFICSIITGEPATIVSSGSTDKEVKEELKTLAVENVSLATDKTTKIVDEPWEIWDLKLDNPPGSSQVKVAQMGEIKIDDRMPDWLPRISTTPQNENANSGEIDGAKKRSTTYAPWLWQVVSNATFEIDTDKLDYLIRDSFYTGVPCKLEIDSIIGNSRINRITGNIEFDHKKYAQVYEVFMSRYQLHRVVYHHKTVLALEFMVIRYLKLLFQIPLISEQWNLFGDEILEEADKMLRMLFPPSFQQDRKQDVKTCNDKNDGDGNGESSDGDNQLSTKKVREILEKCVKLKLCIDTRQIPKIVFKFAGHRGEDKEQKDTAEDTQLLNKLREQGFFIHRKYFSIGFCSNESLNPLDNLFFFDNNASEGFDSNIRSSLHCTSTSSSSSINFPQLLSNKVAHERITHVYKEKVENIDNVVEL